LHPKTNSWLRECLNIQKTSDHYYNIFFYRISLIRLFDYFDGASSFYFDLGLVIFVFHLSIPPNIQIYWALSWPLFSLWSLNFYLPPVWVVILNQDRPLTFEIFICLPMWNVFLVRISSWSLEFSFAPPVWGVILVRIFTKKKLIQAQIRTIRDIFLEHEGITKIVLHHFKCKWLELINFVLFPCNGLKLA
jgi:hypothetical protein